MGMRVEPTQINIAGTTPISEVYVGGIKVRPSDNWTLYDETILANSQGGGGTLATLNGKIVRCTAAYWNGRYSISSRIVGADTYPVAEPYSSHGEFRCGLPSAYFSELFSHRWVKAVIDYMYIKPSGSYGELTGLLGQVMANSGSFQYSWGSVVPSGITNYNVETPYSLECVFDTSDMTDIYTTYKLKNLLTNTSETGSFIYHPNTTEAPNYIIANVTMDQAVGVGEVYLGDLHLYYKD